VSARLLPVRETHFRGVVMQTNAISGRGQRFVRSVLQLALVAVLALFGCAPAHAQVSASLRGVVIDASSTLVPGANVTVRNVETGAIRSTSTDEAGRYVVVSLPVGEYEVRAAKTGFQEEIRAGVRLVVGQAATVDFTLQVSTVKSEVRVEGD